MFEKLNAGLNVFRKGSEVANVEAWKAGQITGTVVGAFIIALVNLAAAFGHPLPVDVDTANAIGGGIVALANVLLTAATSKRAGLLPASRPAGDRDGAGAAGMPGVAEAPKTDPAALQPVRRAANGDILDGLDTTFAH